jgi:flagellar biosynthesis/type III secretory pathway protein FliH
MARRSGPALRGKGSGAGREEGMERGMQRGMQQGLREAVLRQLVRRFGPLPKTAAGRLAAIRSAEELARLGERALQARSLAELGLA